MKSKFKLFRKQKVLFVDDSYINVALAECLMKNWNLCVDVAHTGPEAVRKALATDYDIMFINLRLQNVPGGDATKQIRRLGNGSGTLPIVAVSSVDRLRLSEAMQDAGVNGYIAKPYSAEILHAELRRLLG